MDLGPLDVEFSSTRHLDGINNVSLQGMYLNVVGNIVY